MPNEIDFEQIATQNAELTKAARLDERRRIGILILASCGVALDHAPPGIKKVFETVIQETFMMDEETKHEIENGDAARGSAAFEKVMQSLDIDKQEVQEKAMEYTCLIAGADAVEKLQNFVNKLRDKGGG